MVREYSTADSSLPRCAQASTGPRRTLLKIAPAVSFYDFTGQTTASDNNPLYGLRVARNHDFEHPSGPIFSVIPVEYDSLTKHVLDSSLVSNDALGKLHWRAMSAICVHRLSEQECRAR